MLRSPAIDEGSISPSATPDFHPETPERGRIRTRYPSHLSSQLDSEGKPRPLLHRRGTSHTYETLEDLLKEAGYKETRIFTPEMERREAETEGQKARQKLEVNRRKDSVGVGGAVVKLFSTWMSKKAGSDTVADDPSYPSSPLAHRTRTPLSNVSTLRLPSPPKSSDSSMVTVRPSSHLHLSLSLQRQHLLTRQPSRPTFESSSTFDSTSQTHSRARLALRHAASAPHIDKRRIRTQPRSSRINKARAPPLPVTWLESLSAALLSPRLSPPAFPSASGPTLRKSTVLSKRQPTSVAVTITNVVCRSAPPSRSSSAVRPANKVQVLVPTLAQTCVCEELASTAWPSHSPHHLPQEPSSPSFDEDEDEELNLTMMLIPSKRQHSIRSLRSVLHQHSSLPCSSSVVNAREEFERVMRRRIDEGENEIEAATDGDGGDGHWDSGEFLTARVKRRRSGLPKQWSWAS